MSHARFAGLLVEALETAGKNQSELAYFFEAEGRGKSSSMETKIAHWKKGSDKPSKSDLWTIFEFFYHQDPPVAFPLNAARACFGYPQVKLDTVSSDEAHAAELARLRSEHEAALGLLEKTHAADVATLTSEHQAALARREETYAAELKRRDREREALAHELRNEKSAPTRRVAAAVVVVGLMVAAAFAYVALRQPADEDRRILSYDFEEGAEMWGRHLPNTRPAAGDGVAIHCDQEPRAHSGRCSLEAAVLAEAPDILVGIAGPQIAPDTEAIDISVASGRDACTGSPLRCSTAKVFVLDAKDQTHFGDAVELSQSWQGVTLRLEEQWPRPFKELGVLVFVAPGFKGPLYLDSVTLR